MRLTLLAPALLLVACGGGGASSAPAATAPAASAEVPAVDMAEPTPAASAPAPAAPAAAPATPPADVPPAAPSAKVEFPPHASVEQAIKAVPQGQARLNMSNDLLQAPLLDLKRYDKCKVPRTTKVEMSVAVYDGVAVGVDVITKPKNAKVQECLDGVVRSITWEKVPSLNQANVNF